MVDEKNRDPLVGFPNKRNGKNDQDISVEKACQRQKSRQRPAEVFENA